MEVCARGEGKWREETNSQLEGYVGKDKRNLFSRGLWDLVTQVEAKYQIEGPWCGYLYWGVTKVNSKGEGIGGR